MIYFMDKNSLVSLLILFVMFFVLPSLMKRFGKYTLSTRDQQKDDHGGIGLPPAEEAPPEHREEGRWGMTGRENTPTVVSDEPIHPKWF